MNAPSALVCIDYINDIVDPEGKLAGHGYPDFMARRNTAKALEQALGHARADNWLIIHVRVAFSQSYVEHPAHSPLMGQAKDFQALCDGTWGTQFHACAEPKSGEKVLTKRRVSAFFGTDLELTLKARSAENLYICGVATDLAVQSTAREAHDRDFTTFVIPDACAAAQDGDHDQAIASLAKIASIVQTDTL